MGARMAAPHSSLLQLFLLAGALLLAGATTVPLSRQAEQQRSQDQKNNNFSIEGFWHHKWDAIASTTALTLTTSNNGVAKFPNGTELQLFPKADGHVVHKHVKKGRVLGDFRQCSPCTCCDRSRRWCLPTLCCYNIRCGLTGLPFGLCSFVPISCTCFGCRN